MQENYNLKKQLAALASFKPDDDEQLKDVKDELKEQINEQINEKNRADNSRYKEHRASDR